MAIIATSMNGPLPARSEEVFDTPLPPARCRRRITWSEPTQPRVWRALQEGERIWLWRMVPAAGIEPATP